MPAESNIFDFKPDWSFGPSGSPNFIDDIAQSLNKGIYDSFSDIFSGAMLSGFFDGVDRRAIDRKALNDVLYRNAVRKWEKAIEDGVKERREKAEAKRAAQEAKQRMPEIEASPRAVEGGAAVGLNWQRNVTEIGRENLPTLASTFEKLQKAGFVQDSSTAVAVRKGPNDPGAVRGVFSFSHPDGFAYDLFLFGNTGQLEKEGVFRAVPTSRAGLAQIDSVTAAKTVPHLREASERMGLGGVVDTAELHYTNEEGNSFVMRHTKEHGAEQSVPFQALVFSGLGSSRVAPLPIDLVPGTKLAVDSLIAAGFQPYENYDAQVDRDGKVSGGYKLHKGSVVADISLSGDRNRIVDSISLSSHDGENAPLLTDAEGLKKSASELLGLAGGASGFVDMVKIPAFETNADGSHQLSSHSIAAHKLRPDAEKEQREAGFDIAPEADVSFPKKGEPSKTYEQATFEVSLDKDGAKIEFFPAGGGETATLVKHSGKAKGKDAVAWGAIRAVDLAAERGLDFADVVLMGRMGDDALSAERGDGKASQFLFVAKRAAEEKGVTVNILSEVAAAQAQKADRQANTFEDIFSAKTETQDRFLDEVLNSKEASPKVVQLAATLLVGRGAEALENSLDDEQRFGVADKMHSLSKHEMADSETQKLLESSRQELLNPGPTIEQVAASVFNDRATAEEPSQEVNNEHSEKNEKARILTEERPNETERPTAQKESLLTPDIGAKAGRGAFDEMGLQDQLFVAAAGDKEQRMALAGSEASLPQARESLLGWYDSDVNLAMARNPAVTEKEELWNIRYASFGALTSDNEAERQNGERIFEAIEEKMEEKGQGVSREDAAPIQGVEAADVGRQDAAEADRAPESEVVAERSEREEELASHIDMDAEAASQGIDGERDNTVPAVPQYDIAVDEEKRQVGLFVEDSQGERRELSFAAPEGYDTAAMSAFGVGQAVEDARRSGYGSISVDGQNLPSFDADGMAGIEMMSAQQMASFGKLEVGMGQAERMPAPERDAEIGRETSQARETASELQPAMERD